MIDILLVMVVVVGVAVVVVVFGCVRVGFKFNHSWASWTG